MEMQSAPASVSQGGRIIPELSLTNGYKGVQSMGWSGSFSLPETEHQSSSPPLLKSTILDFRSHLHQKREVILQGKGLLPL